jgi:hypothetical protein
MLPRCSHFVWMMVLGAAYFVVAPVHGQVWKHFVPTNRGSGSGEPRTASGDTRSTSGVPAGLNNDARTGNDNGSSSPTTGAGDYAIAQSSGPWLIVAASFSGNGAEKQAHDLAQELRDQFRLRAYVHEMNFKIDDDTGATAGSGYGSNTRRHLRRGNEFREIAVLIGDYAAIDGPDAQQMLSRIKTLQPKALDVNPNQSAQSMAEVRQFTDSLMEKFGKARKRGPMAQAFFTRNPLLPREYFVPKGVDAFVAKMNDGGEHNLLDCPGRQTIQIATFRGTTILQTSSQEDAASKSFWNARKKDEHDPLVKAAENAHLLTKELRSHGFEAYEFHDRTQSMVTIGSFTQAAQQLPDGRVVATPEVQKIIQTFDASFDTPADPLSPIGNDSRNLHLVEEQQQQLRMKLNNQNAQVVPGLNPKHVKILKGRGKNISVERIIPLDVHPQVIDVPKRSVSSAYAS